MSYGPQLPPHLQKPNIPSDSESDEDGPKLPSVACRGPKPIGPHLPSAGNADSEEEGDIFGPTLPSTSKLSSNIGPQLPFSVGNQSSDEDDDVVVGPVPPKPGEEITEAEAIVKSFEARAQKMRDKLDGKHVVEEPKREAWMLELPTTKAKNFGLGPRTFSKSTNPKAKQDRSWTETPEDRAKRAAGISADNDVDHSQDEDVLAYMATLKRDEEMDKVSQELSKKRGTESLMEQHSKKLKKKEKDQPKERRPFDRDLDLQANRFDDARKQALLKKSSDLGSRFSSGQSKYL